jgi:formyltetrahydrofolate-dependent phosphoribosylglycinamide formyltransferase
LGEQIVVYTDGGSRGNPGPAAAAYVLTDASGGQLAAKGFFLGRLTNNAAEYAGVIKGLQAAFEHGADRVVVFSDSELLVRQINGQYRVKSPQLKTLYEQSIRLLGNFAEWQLRHTARQNNKQADYLVNQAIDLQRDVEPTSTGRLGGGKRIRLGVLISGGGRTLMNIHEEIKARRLNAEIAVVISSRSAVAGVEKARAAGLPVVVIRTKDFPDVAQFSARIEQELAAANVELVVQAGWLCMWEIPARYGNRVMNIHPALLPGFGGKGMWGHRVHEAVLKAGCKVSGCTVHFCTDEYDKGPIVVQRCCEVKEQDTSETLAERVFEQECIAYLQAIRLFAEGRITVEDGLARVKT